jgi:hypothetical protein
VLLVKFLCRTLTVFTILITKAVKRLIAMKSKGASDGTFLHRGVADFPNTAKALGKNRAIIGRGNYSNRHNPWLVGIQLIRRRGLSTHSLYYCTLIKPIHSTRRTIPIQSASCNTSCHQPESVNLIRKAFLTVARKLVAEKKLLIFVGVKGRIIFQRY